MNDDRLRRLLGAPELSSLRMRLRARFERGEQRDAFTLNDLNSAERRALEGLLGRSPKAASSMQLSRSELDHAIQRAGLAADLRSALESLDGAIQDRRAEQARHEQAWRTLLDGVTEPRLRSMVSNPSGVALLKRCAVGDAERATSLLEQASRVLSRVPARGIPLAHLAAESLGDSHALDAGQPVAALVLRACRVSEEPEEDASVFAGDLMASLNLTSSESVSCESARPSIREQWARLGVTVNELVAPALCLNLRTTGDSPCADVVRAAARYGEPVHLSLRALLRNPPLWDVADVDVYVCENPEVVAMAADRLGARCAPLVCTHGMPAAAQRTLLQQLAAARARLHYHGDFDWPGIGIANFVIRTFGALPWRMSAEDYLASATPTGLRLPAQQRVIAKWDAALSDAMSAQEMAVHEERVIEELIKDLERALVTVGS